MEKTKLFSVTASDCDWDFYVGSGDGGQNRQKRNTAVRCTHRASGAVGKASDGREQVLNRRRAFERMSQTKEFQGWLKAETARRMGQAQTIEQKVEQEMMPHNIKVEHTNKQGKWVEGDVK